MRDHTACSTGYNLNAYHADGELARLNSQVNEQANADLRNLGKSITYMSGYNVMHHVALFFGQRNRQKQQQSG